MKEKKKLPTIKKKSQRPSTILILALCLIGFTGIASYKPASINSAPKKIIETKNKENGFADLFAEKRKQFENELEIVSSESSRLKSMLDFYDQHLFGIDVSHYQGLIDWDELQFITDSVAVDFIFIRASVGDDTNDNRFAANWEAAGEKNIVRGAYHYYRPDENSLKQARNFMNSVKLTEGDLPPVLDIEALPRYQSISSLRKGIQNWLDIIENHYGVKPIIYTGDTFYKHHLANYGFDDYTFWIANYNPVPEPQHPEWGIWQFSMKGRISGISHDVDLNVFNGDSLKLQSLRISS